jgi:hypothetical protein
MCWTLNHQNILEMAKGHISLSVIYALIYDVILNFGSFAIGRFKSWSRH